MDENHRDRANHQQTWRQRNKQILIIAIVIILVLLIAFVLAVHWFGWDWTGLGPYIPPTKDSNFQRGKTLWDWMQLLIIPVVLAVAGFWFSHNERKATEQRADTDREIALDNQQQGVLEAYIDKISELLLHENLRQSKEADEIRTIVRARTLIALSGLDGRRKGKLIQFLHESDLINHEMKSTIILYDAELSGADLKNTNLANAYLCATNLSGANLSMASLIGACLGGANLKKANLHAANLSKAQLSTAYKLIDNIPGVLHMYRQNTKLNEADLSEASLFQADLSEADLSGADLSNTNLSEANLERANLTKAIVTSKQLDRAKSLKGTIMPDGSIHP